MTRSLGEFMMNALPEDKKKVFDKALKKAIDNQNKVIEDAELIRAKEKENSENES